MVHSARAAVNRSLGQHGIRNDSPDRTSSGNPRVRGHFDSLGRTPVILDLLHKTDLLRLVQCALGGNIKPLASAQIRLCFPADENSTIDIDLGVRQDEIPFNCWNGHVDGFWNKVYGQNNPTSTGSLSDPQPGATTGATGATPPMAGEGIHDFTMLLGIPLSSQLHCDTGNLGLLRGGHQMLQEADSVALGSTPRAT
eukprot:SAG31_NODE_9783_length_1227_cov_11.261525_1_plen_197_part_00